MNNIEYFITIIAWIASVFFSFRTCGKLYLDHQYNNTSLGKLEQSVDGIKGFKKTWPLKNDPFIAVIAIIWLIVYYFG